MTKIVNFAGKNFSFPDDASDEEISSALNSPKTDLEVGLVPIADKIPFYKDSSIIAGGLVLFVILIAFMLLRNFSTAKLANFYSVLQKILIIVAVLFAFWIFRYEVTATHPHLCLDRWIGKVVNC